MRSPAQILTILGMCSLAVAGPDEMIGTAIMDRDVFIPDTGEAGLRQPEQGDTLPCTSIGRTGYYVVCRDVVGRQRFAFMPFRDEWGHGTASVWLHDATLDPYTLAVKAGVALRPAGVLLARGERFPIIGFDEMSYILDYTRGNVSCRFSVNKEHVEFELPPDPPEKLPADEIEEDLAEVLERSEELQGRVQFAVEQTARLTKLIEDLNTATQQNRELAARLTVSEEIYRALSSYVPSTETASRVGEPVLEDAIRKQAGLSIEQLINRIETGALEDARARRRAAELELEALRTRSQLTTAELVALRDSFGDPLLDQEKQEVLEMLRAASREQAESAGHLKSEEIKRDALVELAQQLQSVQEENARLQAALEAATEELEALRRQLRGEDETPAPPDGAPPTTPIPLVPILPGL